MLDSTVQGENGEELCLPCAPGGSNANRVLNGEGAAIVKEVVFFGERLLLVGAGLYLTGVRKNQLIRGSVAGALAVESFMLGYVFLKRRGYVDANRT